MSKTSIVKRIAVEFRELDMIITGYKATLKTRRLARLHESCYKESIRRIQYREFGGNLCIALDNVPILAIGNADPETLDACRDTFMQYIFKQRGGDK